VSKRTVSNEESAGRMREATHGLLQHAEGLRESVRQFRI
jgi:methyl-accepting chemotaxis protein